jgi:hypothetical protein
MLSPAACETAGQHPLQADQVVEAAQVVEFLSGSGAGMRIHGAWIRGDLNLDEMDCAAGLRLTGCRLDQPLTLRNARLPWLVLEECVLPAVWADRAWVGTLTIKNSLVTGQHPEGALRFADARVTADLRLTGTRVDSPAGPAVLAAGLAVDGSAFLETLDARGASPAGAVCFTGATIGDDLVLQGARLIAGGGPAFNGETLIVKGAAWLDQGFTATGAGPSGAVCLTGARISRQLSLRGAKLANGSGPALAADLVTVRAGLMADQGFTAIGAGGLAAVRLNGASVQGYLLLDGATVTNRSGPALAANRLDVQGDLTMARHGTAGTRFSATGAAGPCTVELREASISGTLSLERATVVSYPVRGQDGGSGPGSGGGAVGLSGATIGGDLVLADFHATGTGDLGTVCLAGAHVHGQLCLRGAVLTSKNGPALGADEVIVGGDALLDLGFTATGAGPRATLGLRAAAIGGRLSLSGAVITNGTGPALVADAATVHGGGQLDDGFTATGGGGQRAVVSLAGAHVDGQLSCTGRVASGRPGVLALDLGRARVGGLLLSTSFAATVNADGLACSDTPVLFSGNLPARRCT